MSYLSNSAIWAEMARRKIQFHPNENWKDIQLWGLFQWQCISHKIKSGELLTDMKKENETVWVRPSKKSWNNHIQPLINKYSLDELTGLAGW